MSIDHYSRGERESGLTHICRNQSHIWAVQKYCDFNKMQ